MCNKCMRTVGFTEEEEKKVLEATAIERLFLREKKLEGLLHRLTDMQQEIGSIFKKKPEKDIPPVATVVLK